MAWLTLPAQLTSRLDAVNVLIRSLGETSVTSIDPPPTSDVDDALGALNEADLEVQSRGWRWNSETEFPLTVDVDGFLPLPEQTLKVTTSAVSLATFPDLVMRGERLYDRKNHTFVFTGEAPKVDLVVRLEFTDLPEAARRYITLLATQNFHSAKQGVNAVLQVNAQAINRALAALEQYEDSLSAFNTIQGNSGVVSQLYGLGGLRRNRAGLS